uniref:(northern house mosquito) hypothetical protein n=1 Tax=Culex pipiens TaxID=7175 RepID=A0A8D8A1C5_CULPI
MIVFLTMLCSSYFNMTHTHTFSISLAESLLESSCRHAAWTEHPGQFATSKSRVFFIRSKVWVMEPVEPPSRHIFITPCQSRSPGKQPFSQDLGSRAACQSALAYTFQLSRSR